MSTMCMVAIILFLKFHYITGAEYSLSGSAPYGIIGEDYRFTCQVSGYNIPEEVRFFRDDGAAVACKVSPTTCESQSHNIRHYTCGCINGNNRKLYLNMTDIQSYHALNWTCGGKLYNGVASLPVTLPIYSQKYSLSGSAPYGIRGEDYRFTCQVSVGNIPIEIGFNKGSESVCEVVLISCQEPSSSDTRYTCGCINGNNKQLYLNITNVTSTDTGNWTCGDTFNIGTSPTVTLPVYYNCPEEIITSNYTGVNVEYRIPETIHGQTWETEDICFVDGAPIGVIKCFDAVWSKMIFNENCNVQDSLMSGVTTNLSEIARSNLTDNVKENLVKVKFLTSVPDELTPLDVIYTTIILDGISKTDNITQQDATNFINTINNIQNSKEKVVTEANEDVNISNKLIASLDELELRIPTDDDDGHFRLVTNKTVVEVWNLTKLMRNPVIGLSVNGEDSDPIELLENSTLSSLYENTELIYKTTTAGILLNKQFVRRTISEKNTSDIRLSMRVLNSSNLFITDNNGTVNSKVISATLTIDRKPVVNLNGSFVTTVFFPQNVLQDKYREKYSHCVFWDFSLNNARGGWSNDGCRYVNTTEERDVCVCDHLTNFALLMDFYGQDYLVEPSHQQALSIITYIGLSLSIIGLGLTVLMFLIFKKLRERRPQHIMFNLALAMLFSWIVFLAGTKQTGDHVGCIVVAVLLHYFILASFMWMLVEGILLYFMFVRVLGTYVSNFVLKAAILAWGKKT
ncbi:adhesion G-protein coupled receptor G6 isoform X2 [Patella vulgata]|uniref:adhesion G-protein coupled receptor G6 isoform X2 n=1 Tax=Patella vulgata TaxID=6465 RepID=UPI0024A7F22E|nr:adhesion G-protein coupled receptor G6 isoform X2 [Patella vulgata]